MASGVRTQVTSFHSSRTLPLNQPPGLASGRCQLEKWVRTWGNCLFISSHLFDIFCSKWPLLPCAWHVGWLEKRIHWSPKENGSLPDFWGHSDFRSKFWKLSWKETLWRVETGRTPKLHLTSFSSFAQKLLSATKFWSVSGFALNLFTHSPVWWLVVEISVSHVYHWVIYMRKLFLCSSPGITRIS